MADGIRVELVVTEGTITIDGVTHPLSNNAWIVGDDSEVIVIDPAHDSEAIARAVAGRRVQAILLTHGHHDHVGRAREFSALVGAATHLHPSDLELWQVSHPDTEPDSELADGQVFTIAGSTMRVVHTPGHTPGSVSLHAPDLEAVFTGDTLFEGGPGATRWPYSSFETIIESITERLLTLPADTIVNTGHGPSTTIGAEAAQRQEWIARGY